MNFKKRIMIVFGDQPMVTKKAAPHNLGSRIFGVGDTNVFSHLFCFSISLYFEHTEKKHKNLC
jgi:hypothetical protein